jgi:hypothetical protein
VRRYEQLRFEHQLKASTPAAIEFTGGLHLELSGAIGEARRAWAREWAETGTQGEHALHMRNFHALTRAMSELATIADSNVSSSFLNRWAAWHVDPALIEQPARELANRLKLATASAVAAEHEALSQQLSRIDREAPLVRLVGRLTQRLGDDLALLPDGPRAALGELMHPPGPQSFLAGQREPLAHICRYAAEEQHARESKQIKTANSIRDYINAMSEQLLRQLDTHSGPVQ